MKKFIFTLFLIHCSLFIANVRWGADVRLTTSAEDSELSLNNATCIETNGSIVKVVYYDFRDGNYEIYYQGSTDGSINWKSDTQITNNNFESSRPFVTVSGPIMHVVMDDNRNGNYSIYYKRNSTGNVGIQNIGSEIPEKFNLYQNYSNPFNPITKIKFDIPSTLSFPHALSENPLVMLKVYDMLGREIATLVNEYSQPGTYEVDWNASAFPSGVYFYKLITDNFSEKRKMILIK